MKRQLITDAPSIWKLLNGVVCIYKPAGETTNRVRKSFLGKLSRELCELEPRSATRYVSIEGETTKPMVVNVFPNFAEHPLVMGPKYEEKDFRCSWATFLGSDTSGVFVLGVNGGTGGARRIHKSHPIRCYHVHGCLGYVTDNLFTSGRIVDKSGYFHVRRGALEQLCSAMQASHQRSMYQLCGVDIQSQAAYELAVKGLIRPETSEIPVVYGIKCVKFEPPNFTIEVLCINEYEAYLKALIHNIGARLHSTATCTKIQCIRHSYFTLEEALLKKHWNLESVIENINICKQLIEKNRELSKELNNYVKLNEKKANEFVT